MKKRLLITAMTCAVIFGACGKEDTSEQAVTPVSITMSENEITPSENVVPTPSEVPVATPFEDVIETSPVEPGEHHGEIQSLVEQRDELFAQEDSLTKLELIHDINKQINGLNSYDFSNVKITCLGDSVTYGQGGKDNEYGSKVSYADYLSEILGCKMVKLGVPGSAIGNYGSDISFLWRISDIPEDTDIIIIFGGINDYLCGNSIYGSEDNPEGTYIGSVKELFSKIRERFPDKELFVVLTYQSAVEQIDETADTYPLDQWLDVIRSYSNEYNFHKIEMYRNGFMNSKIPEIQANYFYDSVHPNDAGYIVIARYIAAKLIEYYN